MKRDFFSVKSKQEGISFLKIFSEFSSCIKLPTSLFCMIREQEIYIFEWSKKYKLNIKLNTLGFEADNPNNLSFSE